MIFMMVSVDAGFGKHIKTLSRPNKLKTLQVLFFLDFTQDEELLTRQ